jgi:hypothetical protein
VTSGSRLRSWLAALAVPALALGWTAVGATPVVASPASAACVVEDATMTWGFKESFRSYISGSIANGEWTVSDGATYETPDFRFGNGSGSLNSRSDAGVVAFPGAITFTGHGGILNTTVENPVLELRGDRAHLLFDVNGTTQQGARVDERAVEFVSLALDEAAKIEQTEDRLALIDVPATLTDAGAAAFGTYQSGEAFDPVTIEMDLQGECASPTAWWIPWLAGAAATAAAGALAVFVIRRRARGRQAEPAPQ